MRSALVFVLSLSLLFSLSALAKAKVKKKQEGFRGGKIYEMNSGRKKPLFTMNADLKTEKGLTVFNSSYIDSDNVEALTEEAIFEKLKLQKYAVNQKQLGESYSLNITGDNMVFEVNRQGEVKTKSRKLPPNLVIGPFFVPFLLAHWPQLLKGEKVRAELAVLEQMDYFGFVFEKIRDTSVNGIAAVLVRMKPYSSLVASVVRPIYFTVKPDGSAIIELKGRMLPKNKIGTRFVDFEGEAVFSY